MLQHQPLTQEKGRIRWFSNRVGSPLKGLVHFGGSRFSFYHHVKSIEFGKFATTMRSFSDYPEKIIRSQNNDSLVFERTKKPIFFLLAQNLIQGYTVYAQQTRHFLA